MVFLVALIVVYIVAILPQDIAPSVPELSDKTHHLLAFMVLGLLLQLAYKINVWHGLLILVGFGVFIEASQYFTSSRVAECKDVLADFIGSFLGLKLYKYLVKVI